jgi:hypothetical protein
LQARGDLFAATIYSKAFVMVFKFGALSKRISQ